MAKAPLRQIKVVGAFVKVRGEGMPQDVKRDFLFSVNDASIQVQCFDNPCKGF